VSAAIVIAALLATGAPPASPITQVPLATTSVAPSEAGAHHSSSLSGQRQSDETSAPAAAGATGEASQSAPPADNPPELADPLADPALAPAPPESTSTRHLRHAEGDPLEGFNRAMFGVFTSLDKAVVRPAAMGYKTVVPKPLRAGLRNAFSNLNEPVVFANDLLQFKIGKAIKTLVRFGINSTVGVAGLFDIAKRRDVGLPHHGNSFGNTLAFYGIRSSAYLFLPFVGPSTVRDFVGGIPDGLLLPTAVGSPFNRTDYRIGKAVVTGLDQRVESDSELKALYDSALDPYATLRSVYLQSRTAEVAALHRKKSADNLDEFSDPMADPAADSVAPPPGGTEQSGLEDQRTDQRPEQRDHEDLAHPGGAGVVGEPEAAEGGTSGKRAEQHGTGEAGLQQVAGAVAPGHHEVDVKGDAHPEE